MSPESIPRRILCAVSTTAQEDGSLGLCPADRHMAQQAIELAARVDAEVRVVHAVDWLDARSLSEAPDILELVEQELGADWVELAGIAEALGIAVERRLRRGNPRREVLDEAREWNADVIAVSPRRDDLPLAGRIFHGSTTTHLLKNAPCTVWVVQQASNEVRRVVALLDLSEASSAVVEATRMLARIFEADLYALSCLEYPGDIALHRLPAAQEEIQRYHREVRLQAREELERLTAGSSKWTLTLGEDWVVREAPRFVTQNEIDLVVIAGTSMPRLAGALIGTTAQKLLEHVGVSAWVTRP